MHHGLTTDHATRDHSLPENTPDNATRDHSLPENALYFGCRGKEGAESQEDGHDQEWNELLTAGLTCGDSWAQLHGRVNKTVTISEL